MDLWSSPAYSHDLKCWVHAGFLDCAHQAWPALLFWLNRHPGPVWLCGHSKGAAEATVIAALMVRFGRPPAGLVTFGSPRVGFSGLSWWLRGIPVWRFVRGVDLVPRVPLLLGWRHVRPALAVGRSGGPISDHDIHRYLEDSPVEEAKPWYLSKAVWGGVVAMAAPILAMSGLSLSAGDQAQLVDLAFQGATVVGGAVAVYGRMTAKTAIGSSGADRSGGGGASRGLAGLAMASVVALGVLGPLAACSSPAAPQAMTTTPQAAETPKQQVAAARARLNAVLTAVNSYLHSADAASRPEVKTALKAVAETAVAAMDKADTAVAAGQGDAAVQAALAGTAAAIAQASALLAAYVASTSIGSK